MPKARRKKKTDGARYVDVPVRYSGKTDIEKVFGPPWVVLAKHGATELHDYKEHVSHRLNKDDAGVRRIMSYEEFYEFQGGILGYITKKAGESWKLSVTVSTSGQFPKDRPEDFPTWQAAWAYVTEHL